MLETIKNGIKWFGNLPIYVHIGIVTLAIVLTIAFPANSSAQQGPQCGPREVFEQIARDVYKQKRVFSGAVTGARTGKIMVFEVIMNEETGDFAVAQTIATENKGLVTCIVSQGTNGKIEEKPEHFKDPGQKG